MLASCASQVAPTGGPKDVIPPTVKEGGANPENLSTHFHSEKISLTFSEFVQLNDATNQIFFSPALTSAPEYRLRGKTLVITLPDSLKENTTYTVNFGSAIRDIREGNVMLDYQYVFSTGAAIDSLRIQGKVSTAWDGTSKPNVLVMLYSDLIDSVVSKQRPDYNARTDSGGYFVLDHLRGGTYKLFALDEQNFNLLYDQPGENIAFADSGILILDTISFFKLTLFKPKLEKQSVLGAYSRQQARASFAFAKPTQNLKVAVLEKTLQTATEYNATKDTITVWVNDLLSDSISFVLDDTNFSDTVRVRMKTAEKKPKSMSIARFSVNAVSQGGKGVLLGRNEPLVLGFSVPVLEMNERRKLVLSDDSAKKEYEVFPKWVTDSATMRKQVSISHKFLENTGYTLLIPDSAFTDLFGNYNDTTKIHISIFAEEELGNLLLRLSFADSSAGKSFFYELRNSQGKVIAKKSLPSRGVTVEFKALPPGNYSLKVTEDENGNFIWDTGNYWRHEQPERIFFYTGVINIRANWDVDVRMNIDNR